MNNKINNELDAWIITYLATARGSTIDPSAIISYAPQQLAVKIPDQRALIANLFRLEEKGLISRQYNYDFMLTPDGLLEYRKYVHPLWTISHHKSKYEDILDNADGDAKSKENVKKILKRIKDLTIEQAYNVLITFLKQSENESVYFIIRILLELAH